MISQDVNTGATPMRLIHGLYIALALGTTWFVASDSAASLNGMRVDNMYRSMNVIDMPWPRHGCRRCRPTGYDIPFVTKDGRELYLNADRKTQRLSVIDCQRNVVSRSPIEINRAIADIKISQERIRDRVYDDEFCTQR